MGGWVGVGGWAGMWVYSLGDDSRISLFMYMFHYFLLLLCVNMELDHFACPAAGLNACSGFFANRAGPRFLVASWHEINWYGIYM